jgi:hypothetical protein
MIKMDKSPKNNTKYRSYAKLLPFKNIIYIILYKYYTSPQMTPGWPYWKVPPGDLTLFFNTSRHILRFILSTLIFYVQNFQRLKNSEKLGTASKFYFFNILGLPCRRMRPRNNFKIFLLLIYVCSHRMIKKILSFDIEDEQLINIKIGFLFTHFLSIFTLLLPMAL